MGSGLLSILPRGVIFPRDPQNEDLLGPFFVGIIVNYFLWGIQVTQSYYYYKTYRETDRAWLKAAVALLFITDAVQSICVSEGVWRFMVDGWGNPTTIISPLSPWFDMITFMDALTASIVHVFYAEKVWKLLSAPYNYICTVIILLLSCCQLVGGIGCSAFAVSVHITLPTFSRIKTWACVWLISASVTDIAITAAMTWKLSKSRTGFKKTDDIISRLIRLTVETGLTPAVAQILDLVVYLIWPAKSYHVTLTLLNPKVYSNSMMAVLNSRRQSKTGTEVWSSHQDRTDTLQIRTTQSLTAVNAEYELSDILKKGKGRPKSSRLRHEEHISPDEESVDVLPFTNKQPVEYLAT